MKWLHAPWRKKYTTDTAQGKKEHIDEADCIFCNQLKKDQDDAHYFILKRFNYNAVKLNRFPYNAGHLLIVPFVHVSNLHEMEKDARTELMELITQSTVILKKTLKSHGTNIGINLEKAGGAGIPSHVHAHVLPRFTGDTNFMPTLGQTKVISFDLTEIYEQLKPHFDKLVV